jgi:hypothetical protein
MASHDIEWPGSVQRFVPRRIIPDALPLLIVPDLGYVAVILTNYDPPLMRPVDEMVTELLTNR